MEKRVIGIRLTREQEDRLMVHAARHKIKKPTTMAQVIFEEGLEIFDGMLKRKEGE